MQLLEDFTYTDPQGRVWRANVNSVVNGASIPQALWSAIGSPYAGKYRNASIVHDVYCVLYEGNPSKRKEADIMFAQACLCGGCTPRETRRLYAGVRAGAMGNVFTSRSASDATVVQETYRRLAHTMIQLDDDSPFDEIVSGIA